VISKLQTVLDKLNGPPRDLFAGLFSSRCLGAGLAVVLFAAPAFAISLKGIMRHMGGTTNEAKAVLASFDAARAEAVLQTYASDAHAADALFAQNSNANAQDLHARFSQMATTAERAGSGVKDPAGFRRALGQVIGQCRSCHAAYN
jgi:cytochrome c556